VVKLGKHLEYIIIDRMLLVANAQILKCQSQGGAVVDEIVANISGVI